MLGKKRVVAVVLMTLVLSLSAMMVVQASARDGWQFGGTDAFFYRNGVRVTGVQEVPLPAEWWHPSFGAMEQPTHGYRFMAFGDNGAVLRLDRGLQEIGGQTYFVVYGDTLSTNSWEYSPVDGGNGTIHYTTSNATVATGLTLTSNLPDSFNYNSVTHRWFSFDATTTALDFDFGVANGWYNNLFFWGHGVTKGWVYVPATLPTPVGNHTGLAFFASAAGDINTPVITIGTATVYSPWTGLYQVFNFNGQGIVQNMPTWVALTGVTYVAEQFLPGVTFVIVNPGTATDPFRFTLDDTVVRQGDMFYHNGEFRIAIPAELDVTETITFEVFR